MHIAQTIIINSGCLAYCIFAPVCYNSITNRTQKQNERGMTMTSRFYVFKDGAMIASTATRKAALDLIRQYQAKETHYMLRANFSVIEGIESCIGYK